jgi:hypothetical protein
MLGRFISKAQSRIIIQAKAARTNVVTLNKIKTCCQNSALDVSARGSAALRAQKVICRSVNTTALDIL